MKTWHIYQKDVAEPEAVKQGINWWAFFFVGLWALIKGLPVAGIVGISVAIAVQMPAIDDVFALLVIIGMMLLYGFKGNLWLCSKLEKDGYKLIATVEAASKEGAKAKILGG